MIDYIHNHVVIFVTSYTPEITVIVAFVAIFSCIYAKKSFVYAKKSAIYAEKSLDFDRIAYFNKQVEALRQKIIEFRKNSISFWTSDIIDNTKKEQTCFNEFGKELKEINLKFSNLTKIKECNFSNENIGKFEHCIIYLRTAATNDSEIGERPLKHNSTKIDTINESISSMLELCTIKKI